MPASCNTIHRWIRWVTHVWCSMFVSNVTNFFDDLMYKNMYYLKNVYDIENNLVKCIGNHIVIGSTAVSQEPDTNKRNVFCCWEYLRAKWKALHNLA